LQDLVELRLAVLRAPAGAADSPSEGSRRQHHERQHRQAYDRQFPVVAHHYQGQGDCTENLTQKIGEHLRHGQLHLVDVIHDRRHELAGGMGFKKFRALLQDFVEDRVPKIRDRGESGMTDQIVSQVVADALGQEDGHDGNRD